MKMEKYKKNIVFVLKSAVAITVIVLIAAISLNLAGKKETKKGNVPSNEGGVGENIALPSEQQKIELPKVLFNLTGKVTGIEKNELIFDATISTMDSGGAIVNNIEPRSALINSSTSFTRLAFEKNSPVESLIKLNDIKVGDYVEVVSNYDISNVSEFPAASVRLLP